MTFARHGFGGEAIRAADRADIRDTCASSSHFLFAQKSAKNHWISWHCPFNGCVCEGLWSSFAIFRFPGPPVKIVQSHSTRLFYIYIYIFFIYKIQTPVTRGWILEYAGGGAACTQPTCGLGVVAQAVHQKKQRIHGWREGRDKGNKERRRTEEVGGLEICGSAESVKNELS